MRVRVVRVVVCGFGVRVRVGGLGRRTFPGVAPPPGGRSIPVDASRPGLRVQHKRPGAELLRLNGARPPRLASGTWAEWRDDVRVANLSANLLPAPDPLRCFSALRASSAASAELFE